MPTLPLPLNEISKIDLAALENDHNDDEIWLTFTDPRSFLIKSTIVHVKNVT